MTHHPRKRFGQHFLSDPSVIDQIVSAIAPKPNDHLVEIGPGEGVLTEVLLDDCAQIDVIEIDRDLVRLLQAKFKDHANLRIHSGDALNFHFETLKNSNQRLRIIGNLPYNISSPLLFKLFEISDAIKDMHFMLQKEVVARLAAKPNSPDYGRLSIMAQYYCDITELLTVPPDAFTPPPRVYSAMVRLNPLHDTKRVAKDLAVLSRVVKEAFTYRRKTLSNALKRIISSNDLIQLKIDPQKRPQELTVEDFLKISNMLSE